MVDHNKYQDINKLLNAKLAEKKVLVAVHRGSSGGSIIENTIPAYTACLQQGADIFECDVVQSTDGVLYAFHDGNEKRLLRRESNIRTMSSETIDALDYYNGIGKVTEFHVQHIEDVLKHFCNGELFNVDRAWNDLAELDVLMRKYPNAVHQAIIKTPVKDEYLAFFRNNSVKYMYMPICYSMDEVRKVLAEEEINTVGVEMIAFTPESEMFDLKNIQWIKDQGLFAWTNAIKLGLGDDIVLCGGYDDNKAITENADAAWGVLMERGYNVIQTDWPALLSRYRDNKTFDI